MLALRAKNPMRRSLGPVLLLSIVLSLGAALTAVADPLDNPPPVTWAWSEPTSGPPVDHYRVELRVDDDDWVFQGTTTETSFTLDVLAYLFRYRLRVQAVADGVRGPYSPVSETYVAELPEPPSPPVPPGSGD
jgi:hypothetical protein